MKENDTINDLSFAEESTKTPDLVLICPHCKGKGGESQ